MASRRFTLGLLLALVLFGFIMVWTVAVVSRQPPPVARHSVLVFRTPLFLPEALPPRASFPFSPFRLRPLTVWEVVRGLRAAARDDRVDAVVVHVGELDWGWAKIAEVRDALLEVRASGKPVYASLAAGSEAEYLLASAAGTVVTPPVSVLQLDGLAMSALFMRGTLEKLDVTPNFAWVGRYKSAPETYTRETMSEANRAALERLLDDEFALLVDSLAVARGMTPDSVRALLDRGPFTSLEALGAGWVDTLLYDDEVDSLAVRAAGARRETLSLQRYLARHRASPTAPRLALVLASGTIAPGRSRGSALFGDVLGAETLAGALREARRRSSVKAIVLRVDSPGGDALASDVVWHEVERCRAVKPVVVSMSDLAASGGYYVGMGADAVVAQPATLTGSIGIYGGKFNQLGLYRKLGFNVETLARGRRAEMLSPFRDFTEDERKVFQRELEAYYQQFVAKVAKGRHLAEAAADSAAGGRVWSGVSARALGLVDTLGGLPLALRLAQQKAGISPTAEVQVAVYPRDERTFLERLLSDLLTDDSEEAETAAALTAPLRDLLRVAALPQGRPWALLPWVIEIR